MLVGHFGPEQVFMDVEGIEPGLDFVEAIERAVGSCRVLIVIIGDEWTTVTDAAGRRRLDDPHDFIRLETDTALRRKIRVVPVLVGGAVMPRADELQAGLLSAARLNAPMVPRILSLITSNRAQGTEATRAVARQIRDIVQHRLLPTAWR